jgi:zinc D-Ala-D-Ala carboxypeptidase
MTDDTELTLLSPHFSLAELTTTSHIGIDNTPGSEVLFRLVTLANTFLEVVRAKFGPLRVTSGYRSPALNAVIPGAAKDSAHCYGCAADLQSIAGHDVAEMVRWVRDESGLDFDQALDEQRGDGHWMHLSILRPGHEHAPRRQALVNHDGVWTVFP